MRLSLATPGAMRYGYDEVFLEGLAPGVVLRAGEVAADLTAAVVAGRLTLRQYEELAGYLVAERVGRVSAVYAGRPDRRSRRESLARQFKVPSDGGRRASSARVDLHALMACVRKALG